MKIDKGDALIKVAIFITGLRGGGAERFSVILAGGLARCGYDVTLLTGPKQEGEYEVDSAVHRIILQDEPFTGNKRSFMRWSRSLKSYLKSSNTDICIAICIAASLVACLVKNLTRAKIIVSERNAPKQDALSWKSRLLRFMLYRKADAYVFQTPGAQAFYSKRIQMRSIVIPNPVLSGLPRWRPEGRKEIVAVGRLNPQKNYPLLLDAFVVVHAQHPEWSLRIFGEGSRLGEYVDLARYLGIDDDVCFEGFCSDVHEQIAGSDIFVMSSDFEGMPNALLEAMAMGMPCISTDCPAGGPAMLIEDGVNGLLCPVGNKQLLADRLLFLIENSDLCAALSAQAKRVKQEYSAEAIIARWDSFLSELVNGSDGLHT